MSLFSQSPLSLRDLTNPRRVPTLQCSNRFSASSSILQESEEEVAKAKSMLALVPKDALYSIKNHFVCRILLKVLERFVEKSAADGVLQTKESRQYLEKIDRSYKELKKCLGHSNLDEDTESTISPTRLPTPQEETEHEPEETAGTEPQK